MIGSPQTWLSVCLCMIAFSSRAAAFTVSGTIRDKLLPIGDVVGNIKVRVMNANTNPDSEIDAVYANAAGFYSTNQATAGQSVYIIVVYEMPLTGPLANGKKAYSTYAHPGTTPEQFSTRSLDKGYFPNIAKNEVINVPTGGKPAHGGDLAPERDIQAIKCIQDILNCFVAKGVTGWACPCDLGLDVRPVGGFVDPTEGQAVMSTARLRNGIDPADRSLMGHEFAHVAQYKAYPGWPATDFLGNNHHVDSTYDEGKAIIEGWAFFVGHAVAGHIVPPDPLGVPTSNQTWRGNNGGPALNRTAPVQATDTGTDYNGEYCSGAMTHVWKALPFTEVFDVVIKDKPQTPKEFATKYKARFGAAKFLTLLDLYAERGGIVYSRAQIKGFCASAPPPDAPGDASNKKTIGGIMFLRGNVKVDTGICSKSDLNLGQNSSTISPNAQELYCKQANNGLNEATAPGDWPQMFGVQNWVNDYEMDTTLVDDGDYDLITRVRSIDGWWDKFDPDFANDSVANRNTDEKWLKYLWTWYYRFDNRSQHWAPDPYQENTRGRVIIDNTAPTITDSSRKPAPN